MTQLDKMRDLLRHGPDSGLSPKQLWRLKLAISRLEKTLQVKKAA